MLPFRISTNHLEVRGATEILVPRPGRKHQTVSRRHLQCLTAGTADQQGGATNSNPKHLMGAGMVVLIIEDTVYPDACPTIGCEATLEISCSTIGRKPPVKQHRKTLIVRNPVTWLENYRLGVHVES